MLDDNHSHSQICKRVPQGARVLELGCAAGAMSRLLRERCQARIVGMDQDASALQQAAAYCERVLVADLDQPQSLAALAGEQFDVVTLADVLEHLKHPEALLRQLPSLLATGGQVLLSVPNIAHASIRLALLLGQFDYTDTGILDATHLRFYTAASLQHLLQQAGYQVEELAYTWHDLPDTVIASHLEVVGLQSSPQALAHLHAPEAVAYQFIVVAVPQGQPATAGSPTGVGAVQPLSPLDDSWRTWGRTHAELASLHTALAQVQAELAARQAELERVYATRSWRLVRSLAGWWRRGWGFRATGGEGS